MAGEFAKRVGAKRLILTHISPRYHDTSDVTPADLLREAQEVRHGARQAFPWALYSCRPKQRVRQAAGTEVAVELAIDHASFSLP